MFLFLFGLLFCIGLFTALFISYAELPLFVILIMVFFGLIFLFIALGSLKHYMALLRARQREPVDAEITILVDDGGKQPSYYARITIDEKSWSCSLFGNRNVRRSVGEFPQCLAWIDPQSGKPLEFQVLDKKITTSPGVREVKPDSKWEKFFCKLSPSYQSLYHPNRYHSHSD